MTLTTNVGVIAAIAVIVAIVVVIVAIVAVIVSMITTPTKTMYVMANAVIVRDTKMMTVIATTKSSQEGYNGFVHIDTVYETIIPL